MKAERREWKNREVERESKRERKREKKRKREKEKQREQRSTSGIIMSLDATTCLCMRFPNCIAFFWYYIL
jgi:hypothetical protein